MHTPTTLYSLLKDLFTLRSLEYRYWSARSCGGARKSLVLYRRSAGQGDNGHSLTQRRIGTPSRVAKAKRQQIASAKQAYWRLSLHKAVHHLEGIWRLAKWAHTKGHL